MDFYQVIKGRRSVRKFKPDPVPDEDIRDIIYLATLAPSTTNAQMWKFLAVRSKGVQGQMAQAIKEAYLEIASWPEANEEERNFLEGSAEKLSRQVQGPVTFAVLLYPHQSRTEKLLLAHGLNPEEVGRLRGYSVYQSIGMALQNLMLSAYAKGYATCPMTGPIVAAPALEKILNVEPPWRLVALVALGLPAEEPETPPRKGLDEVLTFID